MTRALPILLACLLCAIAHAESPVRTLVVGDVVVAEGIDWIAWDAPPESVELLQGVVIDGTQAAPYRASGTVVLRLSKPTKIKLWSGADDPANPARMIVEWSPQVEPSRIDELIGRIAAIESRLEQLAAGSLPQPPPPEVEPLRVDPNTATLDELIRLPGIGPALAQRIIDAREHVVFREPDDLTLVKGIGAATVEALAEFLVFEALPDEPNEGAEQEGEQTMATPFRDAILAIDSAVHVYPGHETEGTTAADIVSGRDGTYVGPTLGEPRLSNDDGATSVGNDGVDDYMEVAGPSVAPSAISIAILIASDETQQCTVWTYGRNNSSQSSLFLCLDNGAARAVFEGTTGTGGTIFISGGENLDDGNPHLIVVTHVSGVKRELWVDGEMVASDNSGLDIGALSSGRVFRVGRRPGPSGPAGTFAGVFEGRWEFAAVFNGALTPEEIADLWEALQGEPEPSTSALLLIRQRYGR